MDVTYRKKEDCDVFHAQFATNHSDGGQATTAYFTGSHSAHTAHLISGGPGLISGGPGSDQRGTGV